MSTLARQTLPDLDPVETIQRLDALAKEIRNRHDEACNAAFLLQEASASCKSSMLLCGQALIEAKRLLRKGEFLTWVAINCRFERTTAWRYMEMAANQGNDVADVQHRLPLGVVDKLVKWVRTSFSRRLPAPDEALSWPIEDQRRLRAELEPIARLVDRLPGGTGRLVDYEPKEEQGEARP